MLRLYFIIRLWYLKPEDSHYSLGYTLNTIEVNLAIVTATIPALWPLGRRWFPAVFESMGIDRPYLYPDIEVGYARSRRRASNQAASAAPQAARALQGKILWLQRPRTPNFVRPTTHGSGESGGSNLALTDIRGQKVHSTISGRRSRSTGRSGDEDDLTEDYHGIIRRAGIDLVHEEDDSSTDHERQAARPNSDVRG